MNHKSDSMLFATWSLPGDTLTDKIINGLNYYREKTGEKPASVFMRDLPNLKDIPEWIKASINFASDTDLKAQDVVITCQNNIDVVEKTFTAKQLELF